jgi:hypothetical protein
MAVGLSDRIAAKNIQIGHPIVGPSEGTQVWVEQGKEQRKKALATNRGRGPNNSS